MSIGTKLNKWRKLMDGYTWGIFICTVVIAAFTLLKQAKQNQKDKERLESQIQQKEEIITEFKNLITGGDSFFFVRPSKVSNTDDALFIIEYRGRYPIYDSTVLVECFNYQNDGFGNWNYYKTETRRYDLGTVQPLRQELLFQTKVPTNSSAPFGQRYFLKISSRNLLIEEDIYIRKVGTEFKIAYKVATYSPDYSGDAGQSMKDIKRRVRSVDDGFPLWELSHYQGDTGWNPNDYAEKKGQDFPETQPAPPQPGA